MNIRVKRAYEPPAPGDGARYLVDRVWPRGCRKEELKLDGWMKDVAPTASLRKWFGHDPNKWREFRERYERELRGRAEAWRPLVEIARKGKLTLVFGARDPLHNNAVALKKFLENMP